MALKLGVLASGRGTNLQAIIDAIEAGTLPAVLAVVITNHAGVPALERAARHGIPTLVIERAAYASRSAHQQAIADELARRGVELVVLAGFDRVVGPALLQAFPYRIINIHPSLLPAFGGGLHAQADALEYGSKVSGCTVHFVTDDVDCGPVIAQAAVPVQEEDTAETLAARILEQEHRILPLAIRLFTEGRLKVEGRRVRVLPSA
ncbi:MAG: phosphoribosylglycinamide formyltransferase [Actinobacteria bacterium]|nr:phosphoribosylglycinamide formyltransferase [Actinomycetota bacterium]